jgi:hypothetical protein
MAVAQMKNIVALRKELANSDVFDITGSGAPTNGTSGTGVGICGRGSGYFDSATGTPYRNINTKASPYWQKLAFGNDGFVLRQRVALADINAGLTLLPALALWKYRMVDCAMIAVGGAAAASTTIDILATQTTSVKLLAVAVAALTRSAVVRAGAANAVVLADGASFVANDVNTAITIGKTGSDMTTATHIDVILSYAIEQ